MNNFRVEERLLRLDLEDLVQGEIIAEFIGTKDRVYRLKVNGDGYDMYLEVIEYKYMAIERVLTRLYEVPYTKAEAYDLLLDYANQED